MAIKPTRHGDYQEITYNNARWKLLAELRKKAISLMAVEDSHLPATVHGSIARGDVNKDSDIDIIIIEPQNSFLVETALQKAKVPISARLLAQATPSYAIKAHIEVDEKTSVSFPLTPLRRVEREFYRFGGEINIHQLKANVRVAGVDKRLILIEPTEKGHVESSIIDKEEYAAKTLKISAETVLDRVHALIKRDTVGRTGIFLKKELDENETFEYALKKLSEENPAIRRRIKSS